MIKMKNKTNKKINIKTRLLAVAIIILILLVASVLIIKNYPEIKVSLTGRVIDAGVAEQSQILENKSFVLWLNITGNNLIIDNSTINDEDIVIIFSNYDVKLAESDLIDSTDRDYYTLNTVTYDDSKLHAKIISSSEEILEEFDFDPLLRFFIWELNFSSQDEFDSASLTVEYPIVFSYHSVIQRIEISRNEELLLNYIFPENYICNDNGLCENGYTGHKFIFEDNQICQSDCTFNAYDGTCNINITNSIYSYNDNMCDFDCFNDIESEGECYTLFNICGNNKTESGEECDDGNQIDGDGCSQSCKIIRCISEGQSIPLNSNSSCCLGLSMIGPKEGRIFTEGKIDYADDKTPIETTTTTTFTSNISGICTSKCGNGVCDNETETSFNCKYDCQSVDPCINDPSLCQKRPKCIQNCVMTPAICPSEGIRTRTCTDGCSGNTTSEQLNCTPNKCSACQSADGNCIPYKFRLMESNDVPSYCDIDKAIKSQKADNEICNNNFECITNFCSNERCIDIEKTVVEVKGIRGMLVKILCKLSHPLGGTNYDECIVENIT